jgi:hypothetical protein
MGFAHPLRKPQTLAAQETQTHPRSRVSFQPEAIAWL